MSEKWLWWGLVVVALLLSIPVWIMNDGGRGEAVGWIGFVAVIAGIAFLIKKIKENNNAQ